MRPCAAPPGCTCGQRPPHPPALPAPKFGPALRPPAAHGTCGRFTRTLGASSSKPTFIPALCSWLRHVPLVPRRLRRMRSSIGGALGVPASAPPGAHSCPSSSGSTPTRASARSNHPWSVRLVQRGWTLPEHAASPLPFGAPPHGAWRSNVERWHVIDYVLVPRVFREAVLEVAVAAPGTLERSDHAAPFVRRQHGLAGGLPGRHPPPLAVPSPTSGFATRWSVNGATQLPSHPLGQPTTRPLHSPPLSMPVPSPVPPWPRDDRGSPRTRGTPFGATRTVARAFFSAVRSRTLKRSSGPVSSVAAGRLSASARPPQKRRMRPALWPCAVRPAHLPHAPSFRLRHGVRTWPPPSGSCAQGAPRAPTAYRWSTSAQLI